MGGVGGGNPCIHSLPDLCEKALRGGATVLQYRSDQPNLQTAKILRELCRKYNAMFIINNDPQTAKKSNADGVHLGATDATVSEARALLGKNAIIGATCGSDTNLARQREAEGADYCAFGAIFPSPTKPTVPPCPLATLTAAKKILRVPIVAVGGITPQNAATVRNAGADALATATGVFSAPNPEESAKKIASLFNTPPSPHQPPPISDGGGWGGKSRKIANKSPHQRVPPTNKKKQKNPHPFPHS